MRKWMIFLIMLGLFTILTGCGSEKAAGDSSDNLVIWVFADPHKRFYEAVAEEFNKTYPDVQVEIQLLEFQALSDKYTVVMRSEGIGDPISSILNKVRFQNSFVAKYPLFH
jgi:arabinosaccharide transport system substrate-binding protein